MPLSRKALTAAAAALAVAASATALIADSEAAHSFGHPLDTTRYILPPGNYGGLPPTQNSTDQLPLYDGLTPLRGNVTRADINRLFLPEDFEPIGEVREEETGRPGLRLLYDEFGIPHVYGKTRADVAFGAGWTTARDRGLLLQLGRGPARVAVADVPNIDAFGLVTSGQAFEPSAAAEALVTRQRRLLVRTYGEKGRQIIDDARAYARGINAYWAANDVDQPPATVNDVIAVTAFIGSIFGAGGGGEAANADLLARLRDSLGPDRGYDAWDDVMLADDPEAPTTIRRDFDYGPLTGGGVEGSVELDPGSIESTTAGQSAAEAAAAPPGREASNFLLTEHSRSATGNPLAVMGPQLGYYYPEIVQQIHLHGPGLKAQGAAVPGLAMYILIGRTEDYAWSLTSAGHDVRDVYAERLCEPDGSAPTRDSTHYRFRGRCRPFESFNAGLLNGVPLTHDRSVHGPVFATAEVGGRPYALTRRRSTFGRDGLNLAALKDMTEGRATSPRAFYRTANQFGFTFNWAYASRETTAYFSSGLLPRRPNGLDRRLPTLGNGNYEWQGFLGRNKHPHGRRGPAGLLLNWNNRSAPGFMHGDDEPFGSTHRVELFDRFPQRVRLRNSVGVMNRAATEDVRSPVWPVVQRVLGSSAAPSRRAALMVEELDEWVADDAPRVDADGDGLFDSPGPVIMDRLWRPLAEATMRPVFGDLLDPLNSVRSLNGAAGHSYVDKDLRTLLGEPVRGRFNLSYCGEGSLPGCRDSLWAALEETGDTLAEEQGRGSPARWSGPVNRTGFVPGLLPRTFPFTNRPTFQQVLEFRRGEVEPPRVGSCRGEQAAIVGTEGADVLHGTPGPDVVAALGGDDVIRGGEDDDVICGGRGADSIFGGNGNDRLMGGSGPDAVEGGRGDDEISGGGAGDRLFGNAGRDVIRGNAAADRIDGGAWADVLRGGPKGDVLRGRVGDDELYGGRGHDELRGGRGEDRCNGNGGRNRLLHCES